MEDVVPHIAYWCDYSTLMNLLCGGKGLKSCISETDLAKGAVRRLSLRYGDIETAWVAYFPYGEFDSRIIDYRIVRLFIEQGVNVHAEENFALINASDYGHL